MKKSFAQFITLTLAFLFGLLESFVAIPGHVRRAFRHRDALLNFANAETNVGTHESSVTKILDTAAVTVRHLLFKQGTDVNHIDLCGTTDVPLGTVDDEGVAGDRVGLQLIGKGSTKRMVASGAITVGALVYVGALGKVASSGTQCVGTALIASATDGDVIEVIDVPPNTNTPGIAASIFDANTMLAANADNTPLALTIAASRVVGRKASGNIAAMTGAETFAVIEGGMVPFTVGPTAAAGSTVADAAALTLSRITQVSSDSVAKGVKLPTTAAGQWGFINNTSATACELYAASGGTVNGGAADASETIAASKGVFWFASAADTIIAFDLPAKAS